MEIGGFFTLSLALPQAARRAAENLNGGHLPTALLLRHSTFAGIVPRAGFGGVPSLKALGYQSPNEKMNVAGIGAGGRAMSVLGGLESENIVALADVDANRAAGTFQRYEKASKYTDFRKMLDKEAKNIDAVVIATPDHMHATAALWCDGAPARAFTSKSRSRGPRGSSPVDAGGGEVQGRHADGQPGIFPRGHACGLGDPLVG